MYLFVCMFVRFFFFVAAIFHPNYYASVHIVLVAQYSIVCTNFHTHLKRQMKIFGVKKKPLKSYLQNTIIAPAQQYVQCT